MFYKELKDWLNYYMEEGSAASLSFLINVIVHLGVTVLILFAIQWILR